MDITPISGVGSDSEMTYRNTIVFTTKKLQKRDLIMGGSRCVVVQTPYDIQAGTCSYITIKTFPSRTTHAGRTSRIARYILARKMLRTGVAGQNEAHSPSVLRC